MTNDDSRAQFPNWKVDIVTKAFCANEEPLEENLLTKDKEPQQVLLNMNHHKVEAQCCYEDVDINDNPVKELLCGLINKDQEKPCSTSDLTVIQEPSAPEETITSEMAKVRTRIVDYDITKDSDSEMSSSGAGTPEKRDSLLESQGKTRCVVTGQAGQVQSTIVDIEDSDSSDDSDLLTLTFVGKGPSKDNQVQEWTGSRIVQEILNEVVSHVVENQSIYIVQDILSSCIRRIDFSKVHVEEKLDLPSRFGATDIRYRKDVQVVKNNALSVVIISPHTKSLSSFHDAIKNIKSRARFSGEASSSDVVRMDFVFTLEKDRVSLHESIKSLVKPKEVYMEMRAVPESDLRYKDSPTLTEDQMLHVWNDNKSLNMFSGFAIGLNVEDEEICFKFESMSALSLFLYCTLGIDKAFLGKVKQAVKVYEPLKLKTRMNKKKKTVFFPLQVTYTSRAVDLACISQQYKCKPFGYKNVRGKPISVTLNFDTKTDLYVFLTSPEARAFKEIMYS